MANHPTTPLASSQINNDQLKVELVEPDTMAAMVRIVWPPQPTVVDPRRFPDVAAAIAKSLPRYELERIQVPTLVVGVEDCHRAGRCKICARGAM